MKSFPEIIPIFPLSGVIYFPKTNLPLNIFEQRYLDLVTECYNNNKLMGMVQSQKDSNDVYSVGCLGKISDFQESKDGRILINLTGITRFKILKEVENKIREQIAINGGIKKLKDLTFLFNRNLNFLGMYLGISVFFILTFGDSFN